MMLQVLTGVKGDYFGGGGQPGLPLPIHSPAWGLTHLVRLPEMHGEAECVAERGSVPCPMAEEAHAMSREVIPPLGLPRHNTCRGHPVGQRMAMGELKGMCHKYSSSLD